MDRLIAPTSDESFPNNAILAVLVWQLSERIW